MPSVSPLPGDGARDGGYGLCGARCCRHLRVLGWVGAALSEPTLPGARSVGPAGGRMCAGLLPVGRAVCTYFRALCSLFSPPPTPQPPPPPRHPPGRKTTISTHYPLSLVLYKPGACAPWRRLTLSVVVFPCVLVCVGTQCVYRVWQRVWCSQDLQTLFYTLYFCIL